MQARAPVRAVAPRARTGPALGCAAHAAPRTAPDAPAGVRGLPVSHVGPTAPRAQAAPAAGAARADAAKARLAAAGATHAPTAQATASQATASQATAWRASLLVEWENLRWSEQPRCAAMLAALAAQLEGLAPAAPAGAQDLEVLVLHDPQHVRGPQVHAFVERSMGRVPARVHLEVVAAPGCDYYEMKNAAVQRARGRHVVFLDSDVIPEPGWLATLLAALEDPRVEVVGGACSLATDGLVARSMALAWFFPLRTEHGALQPCTGLFANNLALRREVALRYPFPVLAGSSRGACRLLAQRLVDGGRGLFRHTAARVEHPAPHGLRHLLRRALAQGRDSLLLDRATGGGSLRASLARPGRAWARTVKRVLRHRRRVGLRLHAVPGALAIGLGYHALCGVGDLLTRLCPRWAATHLRL